MILLIRPSGEIVAVYAEAIDLQELGELSIRRASHAAAASRSGTLPIELGALTGLDEINLQDNLLKQGVDPRAVPVCIQYNKRDLPDAVPVAAMERRINYRGDPALGASATTGEGVLETLRRASELVLAGLAARLQSQETVAR